MATSKQGFYINDEDLLDGNNYQVWKVRVRDALIMADLWDLVIGEELEPQEPKGDEPKDVYIKLLKECKLKSRKALFILNSSMKNSLLPHISDSLSPKQAWEKFQQMFETKSFTRILSLKQNFHSMKMMEAESMTSYLMRVKEAVDQLKDAGEEVEDIDKVSVMLSGLPPSVHIQRALMKNTDASWKGFNRRLKTLIGCKLTNSAIFTMARCFQFEGLH